MSSETGTSDWPIIYGTSHDPRFFPGIDDGGNPILIPFYDIINQTSLDLQVTKGQWLWKFEGFSRSGQKARFTALTGGFEYTFVGALGTSADVGVLGEYLFDERGEEALTLFEDDIFVATRLTLNDPQSTEILAGSRLTGTPMRDSLVWRRAVVSGTGGC